MSEPRGYMDDDEVRSFLADRIKELPGGRDFPDLASLKIEMSPPFKVADRERITKALRPRPRQWRPTEGEINEFIDLVEPHTRVIAAAYNHCTSLPDGPVRRDKEKLAEIASKLEEVHALMVSLDEIARECVSEVHSWGVCEGKLLPNETEKFLWGSARDLLIFGAGGSPAGTIPRARALALLALELMPPTPGTRGNSRTGFCTRKWLDVLAEVHGKAFIAAFRKPPSATDVGPGVESFEELGKLVTGHLGFKARSYILRARGRQK